MAIAYISHPDCQLHDMGHHHPEQPARLSAINDRLIASGLEMVLHQYDAPLVDRVLLEAVHDSGYIEHVERVAPREGLVWLDGDTAMNPHSLNAARRAAGAVVAGVDLVMHGDVQQAFCAVRPPGHHAERHRAMGFCIFNDIAVAIARLRAKGFQQPILVINNGAARVDRKKLAAYLGINRKRVKFASAQQALEITGFVVGSLPPFGHRQPLRTLVDRSATELGTVYGGGGDVDAMMRLS